MSDTDFRNITVIGVGLLGGSIGLAAKAAGSKARFVGVAHRRKSLEAALSAGAVDAATMDAAEAVARADLVILCTPVGLFEGILRRVAPALRRGAVVTDVGSTKEQVVRQAEGILAGQAAYVGSHPIAGAETTGVAYARADLFRGRTCVVTPTPRTRQVALRLVERFWQMLGMATVRLSPAEHDRTLANLSHLPHALAALLVLVQKPSQLDLAGPGFLDTTRIAGGDPTMWRDIFLSNRQSVLAAIDSFGGELAKLRRLVEAGRADGIEELLAKAQRRRCGMVQRRMRQRRLET